MNPKQTYSEKLKDPRWQRKRLEILKRADFKCQDCGRDDRTLHVHHHLYLSGHEPWEYEDDELRSLCEKCHEIRGGTERETVEEFRRVLGFLNPAQLATVYFGMASVLALGKTDEFVKWFDENVPMEDPNL